MEVARLVRITSNLYEAIAGELLRQLGLSDARLGLLVRVYLEEAISGGDPTCPTHLSRHQQVSKNTISALLRGLEEQGLIERSLDNEDRRSFRVRRSPTGRSLVASPLPQVVSAPMC